MGSNHRLLLAIMQNGIDTNLLSPVELTRHCYGLGGAVHTAAP